MNSTRSSHFSTIYKEQSSADTWHTDHAYLQSQDCVLKAPGVAKSCPYACETQSIGTCSDDSSFESGDEDMMPPPSPFLQRMSSGQSKDMFKPLVVMSTLSRPRSASPKRDGGLPNGRGMQRIASLPNMNYGRSSYNRSIGHAMLECVTECQKAKAKEEASKKVAQFDALLDGI